jgi:broad specificity phosphatase PhoE
MKRHGSTLFGLIRHASTRWNEARRIQGQEDSPLSPAGQQAAEEWGSRLREIEWHRILCSDLGRAVATAERINRVPRLPVRTDARLREQDWGRWTGLTLTELKKNHKSELREQEGRGWLFTPPDGESRRQVLERAIAALEDAHRRWRGESILVVCHEGVLKCLLYHLLQRQFLPAEPQVINSAHLHLLEQTEKGLYLYRLNALSLCGDPDNTEAPAG